MMKYINRDLKGTHGYIKKQLVFEIIKTLILFAMALGIFFIGYMTLHTKKSLWSVLAVLALLPACKAAVGVIMLARFRSLPADDYARYKAAAGDVPVLFENVITTSDKTFFVPVLCFAAGSLAVLLPGGRDSDKLKSHLDDVLKNGGYKTTVRIFNDEKAFIARAEELREKYSGEESATAANILTTIKAISL